MSEQLRGPFEKFVERAAVRRLYAEGGITA
jgi:hypothetical protein